MIDFKDWFRDEFGAHSPRGSQDYPALVAAVESALKREMPL